MRARRGRADQIRNLNKSKSVLGLRLLFSDRFLDPVKYSNAKVVFRGHEKSRVYFFAVERGEF